MRTVVKYQIGTTGESVVALGPQPRFLCAPVSHPLLTGSSGIFVFVEDDVNPLTREMWSVVAYDAGEPVRPGGIYVGTGGSPGALRHVYAYRRARA